MSHACDDRGSRQFGSEKRLASELLDLVLISVLFCTHTCGAQRGAESIAIKHNG
ncbi:hypothetical protein RRSWK_01891 [Rhodopirellula sp. SWK7]|nr:hypothetical protein RRSWK_01891 [Rhodopirellula sp. SWK7]